MTEVKTKFKLKKKIRKSQILHYDSNEIYNKKIDRYFKRTKLKKEDAVYIGDKIKNNEYVLFETLDVLKTDKLNWDYQFPKSHTTYHLYLHSLHPVSFLCNAFEATKDDNYLYKAKEIIQSWLDYQALSSNKDKTYCEHIVSPRVLNLIYYLQTASKFEVLYDKQFVEELIYTLFKHGEYLYDDKHYKNSNHGIMADKSLIELSILFSDANQSVRWMEKAIYRLKKRVEQDFSDEGVHIENSFFYHNFAYNLIVDIERFLNYHKFSITKDADALFEKIRDVFFYMLKHDRTLPLIGDTERIHYKTEPYKESKVYLKSGIAFIKTKDLYISFVSNCKTITHKHYDDLSFTLSYKGRDILIDSGKYNYENTLLDKMRQYIISTVAHNTITVDNKNYKLKCSTDANGIGIKSYNNYHLYEHILGINYLYDGVKIQREILFIKPNYILLVDNINSEIQHKYSQIFNFDCDTLILKHNNNYCEGKVKDSDIQFTIQQFASVDEYNYYYGSEQPIRGYMSKKFGKIEKIPQLEYIKHKKNHRFLTLISIKSNDPKEIKELEMKDSINYFTINFVKDNRLYNIKK